MFLALSKAPRLLAPHIDRWRSEHVRYLNVLACGKRVDHYSAGILLTYLRVQLSSSPM
jgi:hypothetical protein